jgi:hypothetical protein
MKKVILVALLLAICGALDNSALAQQPVIPRYVVTYWRSTTINIRSGTVVTVLNQALGATCNVEVEWNFLSNDPAGVSGPLLLRPGQAVNFCSRSLSPTITGCTGGGVSVPPLNGAGGQNQGTAIVSSDSRDECGTIAVEARVYYITGAGATEALSAISNSKVVVTEEGNRGD